MALGATVPDGRTEMNFISWRRMRLKVHKYLEACDSVVDDYKGESLVYF